MFRMGYSNFKVIRENFNNNNNTKEKTFITAENVIL